MNEPWTTNYRGLAIVPVTEGDAERGYSARFKVVRTAEDGTFDTVVQADCDGRFTTAEEANEAAGEAGRLAADKLLDAVS